MSFILDMLILGGIGMAIAAGYRFIRTRVPGNRAYHWALALEGIAAFLLFWVNGAIGIIGSEANDANMMYPVVLLLALSGSLLVRFRAREMSRVMFLVAAAQILVPVVAIGTGIDVTRRVWQTDVAAMTMVFVAMWVGSALLYRRAAGAGRHDRTDPIED